MFLITERCNAERFSGVEILDKGVRFKHTALSGTVSQEEQLRTRILCDQADARMECRAEKEWTGRQRHTLHRLVVQPTRHWAILE